MADEDGIAFFGRHRDSWKKPIPAALEKELRAIARRLEADTKRRDEIIVELLKAGCVQREIGAAADLTHGRVWQIGKKHGWPPDDLAEARKRERDQSRERTRRREKAAAEYDEILRRGGRLHDE